MQLLSPFKVEGATRNDWYLDASLGVTGIVLVHLPFMVALILLADSLTRPMLVFAGIAGIVVFLSITLRRHLTGLFYIIVVVVIILQVVFLPIPTVSWLVIPLVIYDVACWLSLRTARWAMVLMLVLMFSEPIRWIMAGTFGSADFRTLMILLGVSGAGMVTTAYSIGRRRREVREAQARQVFAEKEAANLLLAEQASRQRTMETQIRNSIARELHDVVAHSISVMVVQAEGGLAQATRSPGVAHQALSTISETGRESLQEMRRIVRTLRSETEEVDVVSAPSLRDIPLLIEKANATLTVSGTPHGTTPIIETTLYRVIQEALTNSIKHGGPNADPLVSVEWRIREVNVTIMNKLVEPIVSGDNRGSGLIGMAERVQALEGTLTVGQNNTGGFQVCAHIPLQSSRRISS